MRVIGVVALVVAAAAVTMAVRAPPQAPVWPSAWHADITLTSSTGLPTPPKPSPDHRHAARARRHRVRHHPAPASSPRVGTNDPLNDELPATASGHFYYQYTPMARTVVTSAVLHDAVTNAQSRAVSQVQLTAAPESGDVTAAPLVVSQDCYLVVGATSQCTGTTVAPNSTAANSLAQWLALPASFISEFGFTFVGNEYYLRDGVFFWTQHWSVPAAGSGETAAAAGISYGIDYYHCVATNMPFRIVWTPVGTGAELLDPVVMDVANSAVGSFADVPMDTQTYVFSTIGCPPATDLAAAPSGAAVGARPARRTPVRAGPPPAVGTDWPLAFHAHVAFTGNDFGLPDPQDLDPYVAQGLWGQYWYDWANDRETSLWVDAFAQRTQTTISGGLFRAIDLNTGTCVIAPTAPVNGPLHPQWPSNLAYVDTQVLNVEFDPSANVGTNANNFVLGDHYRWDAFNATIDHSFNYWQSPSTRLPLQFNGPVLDFYPYLQSFMQYSQFTLGLDGVNPDVWTVPANCTNPMASLHDLVQPQRWAAHDPQQLADPVTNARLFRSIAAALAPHVQTQPSLFAKLFQQP